MLIKYFIVYTCKLFARVQLTGEILTEENKNVTVANLLKLHFLHYKFQMDCPGSEPRSGLLEAANNCLNCGTVLVGMHQKFPSWRRNTGFLCYNLTVTVKTWVVWSAWTGSNAINPSFQRVLEKWLKNVSKG